MNTGPNGSDPRTATTSCPRCAAGVAPEDKFCEVCGSDLRVRRGSTTTARAATPVRCAHCGHGAGPDADGFCPSCGMRAPDGTDHVEVALSGAAAVSDRGYVRARNEDAVALGRGTGGVSGTVPVAAVVCDGVSSARASELAARAAADAALEQLLRGGPTIDGERRTRVAVAAAASAAADLVPSGTPDAPSCTLVCGLVERADHAGPGSTVVTVGWVGDSRAYWLTEGGSEPARLLTLDHVAATAPPGTVDPAVVAARPDAITRWLGSDGRPEPDVVTLAPAGSGVLLLCSDGLWKYLPDAADLAALALPALREGGPAAAAAALTAAALAAGGEDNVTVAVVPVPVPTRPQAGDEQTASGGRPSDTGTGATVPVDPRSTP